MSYQDQDETEVHGKLPRTNDQRNQTNGVQRKQEKMRGVIKRKEMECAIEKVCKYRNNK